MGDSNDTSVKLITLDNLETYHGLMDTKKEEHSVELTQAQYDALSPAEKMNGKTYYITDADPEYGSGYATADSVAPVEENSTSSADYAVDDYIYRSGKLYKVIAAISIGDSFVVNTNIRETRISDEFGSGGDPESVDYNSVENKPQINGVTLSGNKTGSDLGLVNAVSGKGLSTNDFDNYYKSKLDNIQPSANRIYRNSYTLSVNSWTQTQVGVEYVINLDPLLDASFGAKVKLGTTTNNDYPSDDEIYAYNECIEGGYLFTDVIGDNPSSTLTIYATQIPYRKEDGTSIPLKIWVEGLVKEV